MYFFAHSRYNFNARIKLGIVSPALCSSASPTASSPSRAPWSPSCPAATRGWSLWLCVQSRLVLRHWIGLSDVLHLFVSLILTVLFVRRVLLLLLMIERRVIWHRGGRGQAAGACWALAVDVPTALRRSRDGSFAEAHFTCEPTSIGELRWWHSSRRCCTTVPHRYHPAQAHPATGELLTQRQCDGLYARAQRQIGRVDVARLGKEESHFALTDVFEAVVVAFWHEKHAAGRHEEIRSVHRHATRALQHDKHLIRAIVSLWSRNWEEAKLNSHSCCLYSA